MVLQLLKVASRDVTQCPPYLSGEPKVSNLEHASFNEDVSRFQISVYEAILMNVPYCTNHLFKEAEVLRPVYNPLRIVQKGL